jgi:LPS export ABC transporter protein LptC
MIFKTIRISLFLSVFLISGAFHLYALEHETQDSDQQIRDFSLSGFGEKGKKAWDLSGKSADIFDEVVKLKDVIGNLYGEKENIQLTADKGDFNKVNAKVHLEDNVVITTSSGTKLTTESLDWDRKKQLVSTKDQVNIERENMITEALGAYGQPNLNKVTLEKDVTVNINPATNPNTASGLKDKIIITCDGPLEIDYEKNIATFKNNVKVENKDSSIYSDIMDVYFMASDKSNPKADSNAIIMGSKIEKIVSRGNVKIVRGENTSYSDEAVYTAADKKIVLSGKPKLIIYSTEGLNAPTGN